MQLRFTPTALRDLTRLWDFIAKHDPRAAARTSKRLGRAIRLLRDQPELGQAVDELSKTRDFVAGDYVVRYTMSETHVVVLRVWHGREDRL